MIQPYMIGLICMRCGLMPKSDDDDDDDDARETVGLSSVPRFRIARFVICLGGLVE